ncbi:MAG: tetratricopeptide repeat protein [Caulobacteraceae bacterium]
MTSDAARTYDADLRALIDRAVQAHQAGRLEEAEALYGQVLAQRPDEPNALGNLGLIRLHRGDLEAGVQLIDASLAARPNQPWALTNKASALIALRRLEEAADCCRLAVEMDAASVVGHDVLGDVLLQLGRPEQALAAYGEAIALRPDHADALFKSGSILLDLGRWAEAEPALRRAAEHAPHSALPHSRLSMLLRALGRLDEALAEGDRAVARDPANVEVRIQRAGVLREIGRPHEALEALEAVLQDHPRHADALMTKAIVLGDLRREREALTIFDAVEAENPAYPRLKWIRCLAHLMLGRYEEGWAGHEDRLRDIQRGAANRQWLGGPVEGKTVVVHAEQGLGDTLQMVRYIPLLAERGARVILMVHAPLLALARSVKGAAEVISLHDPIPPFDLQCAAMSLPYAFGTRVETIPAQVPYLEAPGGQDRGLDPAAERRDAGRRPARGPDLVRRPSAGATGDLGREPPPQHTPAPARAA